MTILSSKVLLVKQVRDKDMAMFACAVCAVLERARYEIVRSNRFANNIVPRCIRPYRQQDLLQTTEQTSTFRTRARAAYTDPCAST